MKITITQAKQLYRSIYAYGQLLLRTRGMKENLKISDSDTNKVNHISRINVAVFKFNSAANYLSYRCSLL